jgi:hypothetical protein
MSYLPFMTTVSCFCVTVFYNKIDERIRGDGLFFAETLFFYDLKFCLKSDAYGVV